MKKVIYILLIAISASLTISSCTEENIIPTNNSGSGGSFGDDKI